MSGSVYERMLGADFARLDPRLRAYFSLPPEGMVGRGVGVYETAGSRRRWLRPLLAFLAWRRVLFPELGQDVPFNVVNTPARDGSLSARREFSFPKRTRVMEDTMRVVDGTLHDFLGRRRGFEVELELAVDEGALQMSSRRLWWRIGSLRLPLPRLAHVGLRESWTGSAQHVDVRITSPVLGEWFRYSGQFRYEYRGDGRHAETDRNCSWPNEGDLGWIGRIAQ